MLESVYVRKSLPAEVAKKADLLWEMLVKESRLGRRWNVGYGQSRSGRMQCDFLKGLLCDAGVAERAIRDEVQLPFPGYFQAERRWDMGLYSGERPVALVEFKYYTLEYKYQQGRGSILVNDLAFKALDLQLAAREAGFDRSRLFVGAFVQIFWKGRPDFTRDLRRTHHRMMYNWAHTKQDAVRKSLARLPLAGLYDAVMSMEANCLNGRDVRWWSFPEHDLQQFLDSLLDRLALEGLVRSS